MNCREVSEFLQEYLSGALPPEQRAEFHRHLAECPWCLAYLNSYQQTIQLERAAFAVPEGDDPPADVPEELIQAILRARKLSL
jgi:anti-sigma factor RsiW